MKLIRTIAFVSAAIAVSAFSTASNAQSAQATGTINVSVRVAGNCTFTVGGSGTTATIDFGEILQGGGTAITRSAAYAVTCSTGAAYNLDLVETGGTAQITNATARPLRNGANNINYSLNWGSTAGTTRQSGTGTGAAQPFTLNFSLTPPATLPALGTYTDTLAVRLSW
jgi:spore coat protein U-like protein